MKKLKYSAAYLANGLRTEEGLISCFEKFLNTFLDSVYAFSSGKWCSQLLYYFFKKALVLCTQNSNNITL